jgi:1-phosphofructokinase
MTAAPHIFTLTCNVLAERTLEFSSWTPGKTQRALSESFQVGGKGINVAKMLTRLRTPNTALCFVGGAPGAECEAWLRERGFSWRAFASAVPTRSGTVVRTRDGAHAETTFLGPDAPLDAQAIQACAEFLEAQPNGQVLAVCGSIPGWNESTFDPLRTAFERWLARGTLVVDTYGPPLAWAASRPVSLIKINADELRTLNQHEQHHGRPHAAQRWIISDGAKTVRVRDLDRAEAELTPPRVTEVSPTGSGDVLLACVLHAWQAQRQPLLDAVSFALPYAAANAAHPGVAEFPDPASPR